MKTNRPLCPRCEGGRVYVPKDMSLVCRRCGYDSRRDEECLIAKRQWFADGTSIPLLVVDGEVGKTPICPLCKSRTVYVRKDRSLLCHRCGYDSGWDEDFDYLPLNNLRE